MFIQENEYVYWYGWALQDFCKQRSWQFFVIKRLVLGIAEFDSHVT
jgi:hypothetical protein